MKVRWLCKVKWNRRVAVQREISMIIRRLIMFLELSACDGEWSVLLLQ